MLPAAGVSSDSELSAGESTAAKEKLNLILPKLAVFPARGTCAVGRDACFRRRSVINSAPPSLIGCRITRLQQQATLGINWHHGDEIRRWICGKLGVLCICSSERSLLI